MNTTKMDLCRRIAEKIEDNHNFIKIKDIKVVIDSCFEEILEFLSEGQRLEIRGFGCFSVKNRKARIGRNPRTGTVVPIEEYKTPHFKFSKDAKVCFEKKIEQNT
jgi:integration host factor subunit beta